MDYIVTLLFIPIFIFVIIVNIRVKGVFKKYNQVSSLKGIAGAQAAKMVLQANGITNVSFNLIKGDLTDHYNPRDNSLNLSEDVYFGTSVAAIGVACHEAGHALQYANMYTPIKIRSALVPVTRFSAAFSGIFIMSGLILASIGLSQMLFLAQIGMVLFAIGTLFQLVTLPTELNASKRAIQSIQKAHILTPQETNDAKKVLTAAAMTYVAALAVSLFELLRLFIIIKDD